MSIKKGNMYVSDNLINRVQKFRNDSLNGVTIAGITSAIDGSALNKLDSPEYFCFDDTNNHRIMRYFTNSSSGTNGVIVAGGTQGNTNIKLNSPYDIAYKSSISNDLFITNQDGHSVIRWTIGNSSGSFIAGTGMSASSSIQLNNPQGIAFDSAMNLYVADCGNHRIQKFMKL